MSSTVTIHEAKTNLSKLIKKVEAGEEVIVSRGSKPVAKLVAFGQGKKKRVPGAWKGRFEVGPEFFEPLPEDEMARWK